MTLLKIPSVLQHFFQIIFVNFKVMSKEQKNYIKATVCAILFHQEKVSMRIIGSILPGFQRVKSSVSKMYSNSNYFCEEVAWQSTMMLCKIVIKKMPLRKSKEPWVLIFDTTHRSRFGKLLESLIGTHGEKSKKRFFPCVWSMLIAPSGERISLPCPAWFSRKYCEKKKVRYKTQPELAMQTFKWLTQRLKKAKLSIDLVIVVDSAFDCNALWKICQTHNSNSNTTWTLITSCSSERCLGSNGSKCSRITGQKVQEQFIPNDVCESRNLDISQLTAIDIRSKQKSKYFYRYANQQLRVSSIGNTNVVMSYKLNTFDQSLDCSPIKFFLCSNLSFDSKKVIAYYSLRWEIETYFREQKSDLGFCHFQAWNPIASYHFIHHLTIAFNFLEFYRVQLIENSTDVLFDPEELRYIRTRRLKETFRKQAFFDQVQFLFTSVQTAYGTRKLKQSLFRLSINSFNLLANFQRTWVL